MTEFRKLSERIGKDINGWWYCCNDLPKKEANFFEKWFKPTLEERREYGHLYGAWMGLEKGDKFLDANGITRLYNGFVFLGTDRSGTHEARLCSPYTEPTDYDKFMNSLTPEQLELAKRLKIEEGEG